MTKILSILFLLASIIFISCSEYTDQKEIIKPAKLLKEDKFIELMVDVRIAESIVRNKITLGEDGEASTKKYYNIIFSKHNINPEIFQENFTYYSSMPLKMAEINERTTELLSHMESKDKIVDVEEFDFDE